MREAGAPREVSGSQKEGELPSEVQGEVALNPMDRETWRATVCGVAKELDMT